ncbi:MAG TPA: enoyl-CoA hydratase-related protein, partial [Thermoanaerobaculia bacterium]
MVVLKRLSEAKRDGDHIYGIIRGSALNHGGKTNGYSVPNPQAQATVIARALAESQTDARHISYLEAHGTGTKLGDPIEIAALSKAFQSYTHDTEFCLIGSVKSNIGHGESAAGIAGLTKVLLQMQHQQIVPSLHSEQLNPHIDFPNTPFIVNQTLREWEQPVVDGRKVPRMAGISSFGAGGSNAHIILEEYQAPASKPLAVAPVIILLSARTPEQLQQKTRALLEFVRARLSTIDLVSMAYTLQVGRESMDERLGFVVSSAEQLIEKLEAYLAGEEGIDDAYQGQVKRGNGALSVFSSDDLQQTIDKWIANGKLAKLVDLWVKGVDPDWSNLYGESKPRRMSLPTYPFAKERYWIDIAAINSIAAEGAAAAALHPLLHRNTSDLSEQRYSSKFAGDEFFLANDAGKKVLPTVVCLEMARAAIEQALPERPAAVLEMHDIVWPQPVIVTENRQINVVVFANDSDEIEYEIYSDDADEELVYCTGRAVLSSEPAPAPLDFEQLERQVKLEHFRLPSTEGYVLHPTALNRALRVAHALMGESAERRLSALESLRIIASCTNEMVACVRYSLGRVDIDLCDERGNVCAQMRGLSWQDTSILASPREIALTAPVERRKPSIALATPSAARAAATASAARPTITLSNATPERSASPVGLFDQGDGVFALRIESSASAAHVRQALDKLERESSLKVLMISGAERGFADRELYQTIVSFPSPVIAVLQGDTIGAGFLFAAVCDFMVCNEDAHYGFTATTRAEAVLLSERFGEVRVNDFLYGSAVSTGKLLRAKGWTCPIVPAAAVERQARELASALSNQSREALCLLKQHLTRRFAGLIQALTRAEVEEAATEAPDAIAKAIVSPARSLRLDTNTENILVITFRAAPVEELLADLGQAFAEIQHHDFYKA